MMHLNSILFIYFSPLNYKEFNWNENYPNIENPEKKYFNIY